MEPPDFIRLHRVPIEIVLEEWGRKRDTVSVNAACELCTRHYERFRACDRRIKELTHDTDEWTKRFTYDERRWAWVRFTEHIKKCQLKIKPDVPEEQETVTLQGKWATQRRYNQGGVCWLCKERSAQVRGMCNRCYQQAKRLRPEQPVA